MKQLLILSGKGGTGKTTVAAAFITLAECRAFADCDVDAPNLHLLMEKIPKTNSSVYYGMQKAFIDMDKCTGCGLCRKSCRFDAIHVKQDYKVDAFACEGCGVCESVCPAGAIEMKDAPAGELILYRDARNIFSTARLKMGSGNSGMLVTKVKEQMICDSDDRELAIIDGSPGIGCPVIASISGVDLVLIVAEPSLSGISDMERLIQTALGFNTQVAVCINKFDINKGHSAQIEELCKSRDIPFTGLIPFDPSAVQAINKGLTVADIDCPAGEAVRNVYNNTMKLLCAGAGGVRNLF